MSWQFLTVWADYVVVDWEAKPKNLVGHASDGTASFQVIWLANGRSTHYKGKEPNQRILDYLNQHPPEP